MKGVALVQIALVSTSLTRARARATIQSTHDAFACTVHVLDLDGDYVPVRDEHILTPQDVGVGTHELHVRAMLLEPVDLVRWMQPFLLRHVLRAEPAVLAVSPGMVLLRDPSELIDLAVRHQVCMVARASEAPQADGTWPGPADLLTAGSYSPHLLAVTREATAFLELWERLAADPETASDRWLDVAAGSLPHQSVNAAHLLVSAWTGASTRIGQAADGSLEVDGELAVALDLAGLDPEAPWLMDAAAQGAPRILLSAHRGLARSTAAHAEAVRKNETDPPTASLTSVGVAVHDQLRLVFRTALAENPSRSIDSLPDPFDAHSFDDFFAWLLAPAVDGSDLGLGRYLASIYRSRPDLRAAYPGVPGEHVEDFLGWADRYGREEAAYSPTMIDLALSALRDGGQDVLAEGESGGSAREQPPVPAVFDRRAGLNVVGYLRAELGIGESARLMLEALTAGGIPHATASVDRLIQSRQDATYIASATRAPYDMTLLCVNADMTSTVAAAIPSLLEGSYRIGMWYWEVEEFPPSQHEAFRHVDEVWVATDFVRQAIEPHSPVPVRTITPPLPQPRPAPARSRVDLGLPERPYFLFSFDFLSTVERKNPWGLVDAFQAAFAPGEGPLLVIKSINANKRPDQAERLRLHVAGSPDVLLLEDYLDAADRDALVALCECYVSLHRAEGLGLTMAEAMALGKPVIATAYGGNLQFMTEANSFLVPWTRITIPTRCEPYPPGGMWAEPDLEAASILMRTVFTDPELAATRGRQAAQDIRTQHSPEVASRQITARLAELAAGGVPEQTPANPVDLPATRRGRQARARNLLVGIGRRALRRG